LASWWEALLGAPCAPVQRARGPCAFRRRRGELGEGFSGRRVSLALAVEAPVGGSRGMGEGAVVRSQR